MDLKHLVSGTDIRGIVSEVEGKKVTLTEKEVEFIGKAFGNWITKKYGRKSELENRKIKVSVGYDARHTGPKFSKILRDVLKSMEIDVYDCQMSITPSLFMTTIFEDYKADGAIMITASHLPSCYNGLKFFTTEGGLEKTDVVEMLEMGNKKACQCEANLKEALKIEEKKGRSYTKNLAEDYAAYTCEFIRKETGEEKPLENLKIVIDAGNGDFGIIFDADGDRSAFIDNTGREINRNNLIALLSDILLKQTPGATIVTDSVTSAGLKKFIEKHGGKHHRFKRGYKNVINEAKRLNNEGVYTPLAIETSGHAAFINNYFLDDGAYMAALLLIQLVKSKKEGVNFTDILNEVEEAAEEKEIRFTIKAEDFRSEGNKVLEALGEYAGNVKGWEIETPNYEGVRIICDGNSWFLLRLSLHEPLLCLNIETGEKGKIEEIQGQIYEFLKDFDKVDITPIKK